jgi:hypothetical protein
MIRAMRSIAIALAASAAFLSSAPASAQAGAFTLANGMDVPMTDVAIRRVGSNDWKPLGIAPPPRARSVVQFSDPDCAFDVRANVNGSTVVWSGVNLCEVTLLTLNRNSAGAVWVDYD